MYSSYFETLPTVPTLATAASHTGALGSVLYLLCPEFNKLPAREQVEKCIEGLLLVLNGIIKLRYKDYHGLSRNRNFSPETSEPGVEVDIDVQGQRVYTASRDIKVRVVIGVLVVIIFETLINSLSMLRKCGL